MSILLKEDLKEASARSDTFFINSVIVPILHAEELHSVSISILDRKNNNTLSPVYESGEPVGNKNSFFLKTDLLNTK